MKKGDLELALTWRSDNVHVSSLRDIFHVNKSIYTSANLCRNSPSALQLKQNYSNVLTLLQIKIKCSS